MIKSNKILIITILFFVLIILIPTNVFSKSPLDDPDYFNPSDSFSQKDADAVATKVKPILSTISTVGIVVSVITTVILGIKYMIGSVSEKAEYKKTMIPYIIGIVFLVSISGILGLISSLTQDITSAI